MRRPCVLLLSSCLATIGLSGHGPAVAEGAAVLAAPAAPSASAPFAARGPWRVAMSRDELFGTEPDEKPVPEEKAPSRDELFGAEPQQQRVRFGGFVDFQPAYTYADPEHWSRGVVRFQLAAQGDLGPTRWKLSGRVDADPVYASSHFYPEDVKRDQRLEFFYRENYLDFSAADWDFRVGAQQIVWGEVIGLFFADVVSARDMREFLLPGFDVIRIPQWAARAEYTRGDGHLELIWIPVPAFDLIGKPGSDFYPVLLPSPLPDDLGALFRTPQRPERTLANSNYGVRANTLLAGWDLAAFYYRSFSTSPTFYRVPPGPGQPFVFEPRYDRIGQVGATFSKDLGDFVLRGETVYTRGHNFTLADLSGPQDVLGRNTFEFIASAEWNLPHDTRLNVQAFERHYLGGADGIAFSNEGFGGSVFVSTKLTGSIEPQLLWLRNFRDGGSMIRPRVNWTAVRNVTTSVGVDIFTGPSDTYFGRYNNRDRVYAEVRYDF